jgi:hypothetical protein
LATIVSKSNRLTSLPRLNHGAIRTSFGNFADHLEVLQLRAMNIIYETTKECGTSILVPSSMIDSLNPATAGTPARAIGSVPAN